MNLQEALKEPIWLNHEIGDTYKVKGAQGEWLIAYYPIFEDGKTKETYNEPRFLMEQKIENGIDFREMPARYISK